MWCDVMWCGIICDFILVNNIKVWKWHDMTYLWCCDMIRLYHEKKNENLWDGKTFSVLHLCETNMWCVEIRCDMIWCDVQAVSRCLSVHLISNSAVQSTSLSSLNISAASRLASSHLTSPHLTTSQGLVEWKKIFVINEPCRGSSLSSPSSLFSSFSSSAQYHYNMTAAMHSCD